MTANAARSWPWRSLAPDGNAVAHAGEVRVCAAADGGWSVAVGTFAPVVLATPMGRPEHVRAAAFRVAREGGDWTESMTVAPDRAAVVGAFSRRMEDGADAAWSITVPGDVALRFDGARRVVLACGAAGLVLAVDRDGGWRVDRGPDACRVTFVAPTPVRITVAACAVDGTTDTRVSAVLRDPALVERIVAAGVRRRRAQGPLLEVPRVPSIVDAFEWARVRLVWAREGSGDGAAWHALGALAAGDAAAARRRLEHLDADASDALAVLVWARHIAWTGDTAALAQVRAALGERLGRLAALDPDRTGRLRPSHAAMLVAALREGAQLAESLGDPTLTALVQSRARRAAGELTRVFGPARDPDDPDGALAAALGVSEHIGASADPSTAAWAALEAGRIRSGAGRLHDAATAILGEVGRAGPAPATAARFALAVMSGLIGWAPDATRDRVRVRPRLTDALLPVSVRGLPAGGATFDLDVMRDGPVHRVRVEQTAGAVPLNLVVEAWLPDAAFSAVSVDGRRAELDARPLDGGWVLPVQLTADAARTIEVRGDP